MKLLGCFLDQTAQQLHTQRNKVGAGGGLGCEKDHLNPSVYALGTRGLGVYNYTLVVNGQETSIYRLIICLALDSPGNAADNPFVTTASDYFPVPSHRSNRRRTIGVLAAITMLLATLIGGVTAATANAATSLPTLPLSTSGNKIVDATGKTVTLRASTGSDSNCQPRPARISGRDYKDMLAQISSLGFNTIRMPYSIKRCDQRPPAASTTAEAATPHCWGQDSAAGHGHHHRRGGRQRT